MCIRDRHKSFDGIPILNNISTKFDQGKTNLIIGQSGSGKTVLLKCLLGLHQPDTGEVLYDGISNNKMNENQKTLLRREMGMVFQGSALFDSMSVLENVMFPMKMLTNKNEDEIIERSQNVIKRVELNKAENKLPSELSGGMRKRVGLARAIIYKPEIIVYDEPTTGLDPVVSDSIDQLVIKMRDQLNCTTIVVTHDTRSMRRVGNHVMMLHHGLIHANGKPDEIFKSTDPIVHKFVNGIADPKDLEF